jgi:hypothetical protein
MTIYTPKTTEKKNDEKKVVQDKLLAQAEKTSADVVVPVEARNVRPVVVTAVERRRTLRKIISVIILLLMLGIVVILLLIMLNNFPKKYKGVCGVHFHQKTQQQQTPNSDDLVFMALLGADDGEFEQGITIDDDNHEHIEVPKIGGTRSATVLHDFNKNVTAIVDREQAYCFVMPLNRTLVMPPRDFFDLLVKLKTGYYIPDVDVIRENYRVITPPVNDLTPFGDNVFKECQYFNTYRLIPEDQPYAMSKRSACEMVGNNWCLGDAGTDKMLCINIHSCI